MKGLLDRLAGLGRQVERATSTITDTIADARRQISETRTALDQARARPLPPAEIADRIPAVVAAAAAYWRKSNAFTLVRQLGTWNEPARVPWANNREVEWGQLCAFAPEIVAAGLAAVVHAAEYAPGPPRAEREATIAQLEREVTDLETAEERLIDDAAAHGVVIAHRSETVQRRQQEAAARQRQEQAEADRQAREAAVNATHVGRTISRSQYLEQANAAREELRGGR